MKINIIIPGVSMTGGLRVIFTYGEKLEADGHDVLFYTPLVPFNVHKSRTGINELRVIWNFIKNVKGYLIQRKHQKTGFKINVRIVPYINRMSVRKADITVATAWPTAYATAKLGINAGKKVYFIQDYEIWDNKKKGDDSYLLGLSPIVISQQINDKLYKNLGLPPAPIVYDGLDVEFFNNHNRKFLKDYRNASFLMLYHPLKKKGIDNGIKCYELIKEEFPNVSLRMFGLANNPNIPSYVEYYCNPTREKLRELYHMSDFFIFPSIEEGWGLTPLEALASKCCVIGTRTGCLYDLCESQIAFVSEPGDYRDMARKCIEAIKTPELVENVVEQGFQVVQQFSWEESYISLKTELWRICNET